MRKVLAAAVVLLVALVAWRMGAGVDVPAPPAPAAATPPMRDPAAVASTAPVASAAPDAANAHAARASVAPTVAVSAPTVVAQGRPLDVAVALAPRDAAGLGVALSYDPAVLRLVGVDAGEAFDGAAGTPLVDETSDGRAIVRLSSVRGTVRTRPGTALVLRFETLAAGATEVEVSDVRIADASGIDVPVPDVIRATVHVQ